MMLRCEALRHPGDINNNCLMCDYQDAYIKDFHTMPRPLSPEPLQRTDLNLYANDIEFLKRKLGVGWTTYIRELVAEDVKRMSRVKTIGDLADGK